MRRLDLCALVALWLAGTTTAWAASGYFAYAYSTNARGMGGVGVALVQGPMSIAANPAAIVGLRGTQGVIGATLLTADASYRATKASGPGFALEPGPHESDADVAVEFAEVFPIPHGAVTWRLNPRTAVGIGVYGNGGLNTEFDATANSTCPAGTSGRGVLCAGTAAADLAQMFIAPTIARQVTPNLRVGLSLVAALQMLEIRGLGAFKGVSSDPANLTNNGHDYSLGYGAKLGLQWLLLPGLRFGASYQTRMHMQEFDDYAGLLAEQGDFDIPPYLQVGLAWNVTQRWTLAVEYQRIYFSEIPALANEPLSRAPLGADDGPGFGWEDTRLYKIGASFRAGPEWTFRFGYANGNQPMDADELFLNLLTYSLFEHHYSVGASHRLSDATTLNWGLVWAPETTLEGANARAPSQTIQASNEVLAVDFGIRYQF